MPHIPGHNTPFTSSLVQGMQNTNQNINNLNRPPYSFEQPFNNNENQPLQGYNKDLGAGPGLTPGPMMPTDELPEGWEWQMVGGNWEPVGPEESGGGFGTGTELNIPDYLQETPTNPYPGANVTGWTPPSTGEMWDLKGMTEGGFDVNNDGVIDILDMTAASHMQPTDWAQSTGTGGFSFEDYQDLMYQGALGAGNWGGLENPTYETGSEWWESLHPDYQEAGEYQFDYHTDTPTWGFGGADEGWSSWNVENPTYGWAQPEGPLGSYYDPVASAESQQGFLENLMNYINPQQTAAQEFTGGGGQAGQAAKELYYPTSTGGFAGVGSGMGGGGGMQSLMQSLMG